MNTPGTGPGLDRAATALLNSRAVPAPLRHLIGHELRLLHSLSLWPRKRRHGVDPGRGERGFAYHSAGSAMLYGFLFVCVVETVALSLLLRPWPAVERAVLFLDVWTVVFVLGMQAASVTRPHVLGPGALRIRRAAHVDLLVPLDQVRCVRRELLLSHETAEGTLNLPVGAQTTVTVELHRPVTHRGLLGSVRAVSLIRIHADAPDDLVREARAALPSAPA